MPLKSSSSSTLLPPGRWPVDPSKSSVSFRVRHFGVGTVEGRFASFIGTIDERAVERGVDVASVETGHPVRDARLRSADYFGAEHLPQIAFEAKNSTDGMLNGHLTIRHVTPSRAHTEARHTPERRARAMRQGQDQPQALDWSR